MSRCAQRDFLPPRNAGLSAVVRWRRRRTPTNVNISPSIDGWPCRVQRGVLPVLPKRPVMPKTAPSLGAIALALLAPAAFAHDDHKLGTIKFPVSCNAEAAHHFTTGMLLQYNYHWAPARKAFENAIAADGACGMAHYGVAVTQMDNILAGAPSPKQLVDGRAALAKARVAGLPTKREQDYASAADEFFAGDEKQPPFQRMET